MADTGFSEDGKYFCSISSDGRLRIWDTETNVLKQEYTPDLHLTSPPTCLKWICASQSAEGVSALGKIWQERTTQSSSSLIALGTKSGKILLYSVSEAKVSCVLSEGGAGAAAALDWRAPHGLYSCHTLHNTLLHWDLEKAAVAHKYTAGEGKSKADRISAIKIVPHNQVKSSCYMVTAASSVMLWCLREGSATPLMLLAQRNAVREALLSLAVLENNAWLVLGARSERLLHVYEVTIKEEHVNLAETSGDEETQSKRRKHSILRAGPHYTATTEAPAVTLHALAQHDEGTLLNIATVTTSGVVHFYSHVLNGASPKPLKPTVTIQVASSDAEPLPATACRLAQRHLTLAYSKQGQLVFENVIPDLKTQSQFLIRGEERREGGKKRGVKEKRKSKEESKERPDEVNVLEPMGGVVRKRNISSGKVEVAMEQRLANLSMLESARETSRGAPAHSLARLLVQGLHSDDDKLISCVLDRREATTALQTVAALPAACVPALLRHLVQRADTNSHRCAAVCVWTAAVLQHEAALLLGAADAAAHLAHLLSTFTHRRSHLCQLLALRGRLQLTSRQRQRQPEHKPMLHYNDDTCSESEVELDGDQDRASDSAGEGEWGADDSGGDQGD